MKIPTQRLFAFALMTFIMLVNSYPQGKDSTSYKKLDSIIGSYYFLNNNRDIDTKRYYYYDNEGNETQNITYKVHRMEYFWGGETRVWEPFHKEEHKYNYKGKWVEFTSSNWNHINRAWESGERYEFLNDDEGNRVLDVDFIWNKLDEDWGELSKLKSEYDSDGNMVSQIRYNWHFVVAPWEEDVKKEWEYDSLGRLDRFTAYNWNPAVREWMNDDLEEIVYDSIGNKHEKLQYNWDYLKQDWELTNKQDWEKDSLGLEVLSKCYCWNSSRNSWDEDKQSLCCYDLDGNEISEVKFIWTPGKGWVEVEKTECCYNSSGNMTLEAKYHWSDESKAWIGDDTGRKEREFDADGDLISQSIFIWDNDINDWRIIGKYHYYYASTSSVPHERNYRDIKVFPNPTNGLVNISGLTEFAKVEIYSSHGQLLKSLKQVQQKIDLSELKPGVYFLNLTTRNDGVVKMTVIKK